MQDGAGATTRVHALVEAYRLHERRIFLLCLRRLGTVSDAVDAAQETFARAGRHLAGMTTAEGGAYLTTVARSVCVDEIRRRQRSSAVAGRLSSTTWSADAELTVIDRRTLAAVWSELSTRDRALFLCRFAGYSYDEIAQRLGLSVAAVRVGLLRARRRARSLLEGLGSVIWLARRSVRERQGRSSAPPRRRTLRGMSWVGAPSGMPVVGLLVAALAMAGIVVTRSGTAPAPTPPTRAVAAVTRTPGGALADVQIGTLVLSPAYASDHTMYASGRVRDCPGATCAALLRTRDAGRTWERLRARGYAGGVVVLPPSESHSTVILASGPHGLQRSDDGGGSFRTVDVATGPAVMVRGSTPDDDVAVVGARTLRLYRIRTGQVVDGPALPASTLRADDILALEDGDVLVSTEHAGSRGGSTAGASVVRCSLHGGCRTVLTVPDAPLLHLVTAPTVGGPVVAFSNRRLFVWHQNAQAFATVHTFTSEQLTAVAVGHGGGEAQIAAVLDGGPAGSGTALLSRDAGRTFTAVSRREVLASVTGAVLTPDGVLWILRVAVAPETSTTLVSEDGGQSWRDGHR